MALYISDGNGNLTKYAGNAGSDSTKANVDASNLTDANVSDFLWKLADGFLDQSIPLKQYEDDGGSNFVNADSCSTAQQIYELQVANPHKQLRSRVGAHDDNSNFKTLIGNPSGFGNYTAVRTVRMFTVGDTWNATAVRRLAIELYAVGEYIGKLARGYIFFDGTNYTWSGWQIIR